MGSNLGDRFGMLNRATDALTTRLGAYSARSRFYETAAWGKTDQPPFLNQALLFHVALPPHELLRTALAVEKQLGRERLEKWGPRLIDIDLLSYGDYVLETADLTLPHPHLAARRFALLPMQEIYPAWKHPGTKARLPELVRNCPDQLPVSAIEYSSNYSCPHGNVL